jgi:tetratricopeptide (TPR) repeat protein
VRERLARRFTELVEHIEARARYSALAPLHDIRADRKGLRAEMAELEDEIRQVGAIAVGPGHYALGRGLLALGDEAKAREYFESSWEHGFQQPRVAYALALVMGHLYQTGLLDAERIDSPERRVARKREIERRYRDPALAYLRQSTGADVPSTEYVAALIAFYEDRLEEALVHLDAISELPWRYEVPALRGDIFLARASRRSNQGDRQGALADFAAGRRAYLSAAAIGESVPEVHAALGELEYAVMLMELHGQGDVTPPFERGLQALSRARLAEPDHYGPLVLEARLHRHFAEYRMHQGSNVENLLGKAIALAERALATAPLQPSARLELGRCYRQLGQYRQEHNQDPGEQLGKSIATFKAIAVKDKDYEVYFDLGLVFSVWANYETLVGLDPLPHRDLAIESYRTSTRLDERVPDAWIQLGIAYFERASHPRSKNPDDDLQEADSAMAKALSLNPQHIVTYFYQGEVHVLMAQRQRRRDADPEPNLATALAMYRKGLTINPKLPQLHNGVGTVLIEQAKEAWNHGRDPEPLLDQARAAYEQAIAVAPEHSFGYFNVGETLIERAFYQRSRGEDPGRTVRAAVAAIRRTLERMPAYASPWADLGEVLSLLAAFQLEHGLDPRQALAEAMAALDQALRRNPGNPRAQLYLAEARGIRARWQARIGRAQAEDFEAAAQTFQKALELVPEDQDYRILFGHFCRVWGAWQKTIGRDPDPAFERGLDLANQVLSARPKWPDARILRASLLLAQAEAADHPDTQKERAHQALQDFTRALGSNPHLEGVWKSQIALARRFIAAAR